MPQRLAMIAYMSDDIRVKVQHFRILYQWSMMIDIHSPNLVGIGSWIPEIWLHEYSFSPIEIGVNWPGSKQLYEPGQFTLISVRLITHLCGHISGSREPIHVKFGVRVFHHVLLKYVVMKLKVVNCKKKKKKKEKRKFDVTFQNSVTSQKAIIAGDSLLMRDQNSFL